MCLCVSSHPFYALTAMAYFVIHSVSPYCMLFTQDCTSGCITAQLKQTTCSHIPLIIHLLKEILHCYIFCFSYKSSTQYKNPLEYCIEHSSLVIYCRSSPLVLLTSKVHGEGFFLFFSRTITWPFTVKKGLTRTSVLGHRSHLYIINYRCKSSALSV